MFCIFHITVDFQTFLRRLHYRNVGVATSKSKATPFISTLDLPCFTENLCMTACMVYTTFSGRSKKLTKKGHAYPLKAENLQLYKFCKVHTLPQPCSILTNFDLKHIRRHQKKNLGNICPKIFSCFISVVYVALGP